MMYHLIDLLKKEKIHVAMCLMKFLQIVLNRLVKKIEDEIYCM